MSLRQHKRRAYAGMKRRQDAHRQRYPSQEWYWYPVLRWIMSFRAWGDRGFRWVCADGSTMNNAR